MCVPLEIQKWEDSVLGFVMGHNANSSSLGLFQQFL